MPDHGLRKFRYEEKQRAKESRKKASNISVKEMKFRPKIGQGDFDTKTRKVAEFLAEGHKVKVTIMFRGREMSHPELGAKILDTSREQIAEVGKVETQARLDGRNMTMVLAPDEEAAAEEEGHDEPLPESIRPATAQTGSRPRTGRRRAPEPAADVTPERTEPCRSAAEPTVSDRRAEPVPVGTDNHEHDQRPPPATGTAATGWHRTRDHPCRR